MKQRNLVEKSLEPARGNYALRFKGLEINVKKEYPRSIYFNKYHFLESMTTSILEKIFSYNVFEDNVDKYIRSKQKIFQKFFRTFKSMISMH
ncbi:MAG: hypothetical protein AB8U61_03285 [Rickettsiales endosymbiont of Dermacentor nuttalli]